MRHVIFVGQLGSLAGNSLFEVMKDWSLSGLVQETNWISPSNPSQIINLSKAGNESNDSRIWASTAVNPGDSLELYSLQLLISKDGSIGEADVYQLLQQLGPKTESISKLVNIVFPTFGQTAGLKEACLKRNQNILVSPTDANSPLSIPLEVTRKTHQYFQHVAKEISSMAGIWPGQSGRSIPDGNVALGSEKNVRFGRSFVRYVDASSLIEEVTNDVLKSEEGSIPLAYDAESKSTLERVDPSDSLRQVKEVVQGFLDLFPDLKYNSSPPISEKKTAKANIIQSLKYYFKWIFRWLRKQPKNLFQSFINSKKAALAGKVQKLYGGENSRIAIYFGNVTTHTGSEWSSFDVTKSIQEAGSRQLLEQRDPTYPKSMWKVFLKTATALADGREAEAQFEDRVAQIELPRFKSGRRIITEPDVIISDSTKNSFSIPADLPLASSGKRLTSQDPLLAKMVLMEISQAVKADKFQSNSDKIKLLKLESNLTDWCNSNESFAWLVGNELSDSILQGLKEWHKGQDAISGQSDDTKVVEAEEKAQKELRNLIRGGAIISGVAVLLLAGSAFWAFFATGAFPVIGATWWIPVAIFSSIFAIWNLLAARALWDSINEYFVLEQKLVEAEKRISKHEKEAEVIWGQIYKLTSFYQQYMHWCRIITPIIHRTEFSSGTINKRSAISGVNQLPASMSVARLMPSEGNSVDMIAAVKRQFYKPGWIEDGFSRVVRKTGIDLNELFADNAGKIDGAVTQLSTMMVDRDEISRTLHQDAVDFVQQIATSDKAYQQWRVSPVGLLGKMAERNGDAFIFEIATSDKSIPAGDLLDSAGKVGGLSDLDQSVTYLGADSRVVKDADSLGSQFNSIEPNPHHPLDFIGVRVELSKTFSPNSLMRDKVAPTAGFQETHEAPIAPEA